MPTTEFSSAESDHPFPLFTQTSTSHIADRLRRLRKSRGWTLKDVEDRSGGKLKSVVLGSYERDERAMNIERAIEIANLFGIPLAELLTDGPSSHPAMDICAPETQEIVVDLRKAKSATKTDDTNSRQFAIFLTWIIGLRQDWNGEVLSLRRGDIETISLMLFKHVDQVIKWLNESDLLIRRNPTRSLNSDER